MLKRNFSNMIFDEFFCYEWSKCQYRAIALAGKNYIRDLFDPSIKRKFKYRNKAYCCYGKSLVYVIMKKIYYYTIMRMIDEKTVSLEEFKKFAAVITEKEIAANRKKLDKGKEHYESVKNDIFSNLEKNFININTYDFDSIIEKAITVNINLHDYLEMRTKTLKPHVLSSLPVIDWEGIPYFKLDIMAVNKHDDYSFDIVITSIFDIEEEYMHRSFVLNMIFNYFYKIYEKDENFMANFLTERPDVNKIIVYNPASASRYEIEFWQIACVFQEAELMKILKIYKENLEIRSFDNSTCWTCENKMLCTTKSKLPNKKAYMNERRKEAEKKIEVMI